MKQQINIYSCILSPFGAAFLEAAIPHPDLLIQEVVLASPVLWWKFHCRLQGLPKQALPAKVERRQLEQQKALAQSLDLHQPQATLRVIDTVHQEAEYERLQEQEVAFCAGFPELFQPEALAAPKVGIVNFHPSYLPRCRGAHPIYWTIAKQEAYGGLSTHFMTRDIDAGPIIYREKIAFDSAQITYKQLFRLVQRCLPGVITATLRQLAAGQTLGGDQIAELPTYHRNDRQVDHQIDWAEHDFTTISAKVRAGHAFMSLTATEKLGLEPPLSVSTSSDSEIGKTKTGLTYLVQHQGHLYFRSLDNVVFCCQLQPFRFRLLERVILRFLRPFPAGRNALLQRIGRRKLKAHYLVLYKSS